MTPKTAYPDAPCPVPVHLLQPRVWSTGKGTYYAQHMAWPHLLVEEVLPADALDVWQREMVRLRLALH